MVDTKQDIDSVIPAEVTELIGESQQIQGWIEKLAELRDETSPAVYEKVHTDYKARMAEVTSRLSTHQSDLSRTLDKRRTGVEKLRTERDEQAAELEEAKLRFAVGEYGSDEWDQRRGRIERGLQSIKDRLSAEDATLEELETILASILPEGPEGSATKEEEKPAPAWLASGEATSEGAPGPDASGEDAPAKGTPAKGAPAEVKAEAPKGEPEDEPAQAVKEAGGKKQEKIAAAAAKPGDAKDDAVKGGEARGEEEEYMDELEFLESLSLEESDRFDAVSAMLDEEEGGKGGSE
jgi:hypothetical protein